MLEYRQINGANERPRFIIIKDTVTQGFIEKEDVNTWWVLCDSEDDGLSYHPTLQLAKQHAELEFDQS